MTKAGVLGLGKMGSAFALNLLSKGHEVHVYNRSKERLRELVAKGAIAHPSPHELGKSVDVVITSLTDQDVKDLASYIIQQNLTGGGGNYSPGELAKRTILWVTIGILAMVFVTYLLAQYNMRWVARRAAARRK